MAAAARLGLDCVLVLTDAVAGRDPSYHASGNLLLDFAILFGQGVANMVYVIPSQVLFQERTPADMIGRVVGFRFALVFGGIIAVNRSLDLECAQAIACEEGAVGQAAERSSGRGGVAHGRRKGGPLDPSRKLAVV